MTPALFNPNVDDAFDSFIGTAVRRADELWELDGETAFRRTGGRIETFDTELGFTGGLS
jgi:hypothetical protein